MVSAGRNPLRSAMDEGVSRQRRRRFQFIAEVFSELSRVTWPTREEAIRLTLLVLSVAVIVGIFVGLWDFGLGRLASRFLF